MTSSVTSVVTGFLSVCEKSPMIAGLDEALGPLSEMFKEAV